MDESKNEMNKMNGKKFWIGALWYVLVFLGAVCLYVFVSDKARAGECVSVGSSVVVTPNLKDEK